MLKIELKIIVGLIALIFCGQLSFAQGQNAGFYTASHCRTVTFKDYDAEPGLNAIYLRKINYGDGTESLCGEVNEHTYAADGNYVVKYYVSRIMIDYAHYIYTDSITKTINVNCSNNYGMKTFLWDTLNCYDKVVKYEVFPQSAIGLKIKLDFGDGSSDSNINSTYPHYFNDYYLHSYSQNKKYFVTATVSAYDPVSKTTYQDTFSKWVHYNCANSAIDEVNHTSKIRLYPNPTAGVLNIETDEDASLAFDITDVRGVQLFEGHLSAGEKFVLDVSEWNKGLYILSNSKGEHLKFVVE